MDPINSKPCKDPKHHNTTENDCLEPRQKALSLSTIHTTSGSIPSRARAFCRIRGRRDRRTSRIGRRVLRSLGISGSRNRSGIIIVVFSTGTSNDWQSRDSCRTPSAWVKTGWIRGLEECIAVTLREDLRIRSGRRLMTGGKMLYHISTCLIPC